MRTSKQYPVITLIVLLVVAFLGSSASGIVYLNRQWDDDKEEWYTGMLLIEGEAFV